MIARLEVEATRTRGSINWNVESGKVCADRSMAEDSSTHARSEPLDALFREGEGDPACAMIATDASVPVVKRYQAVSAVHIYHQGRLIHE